MCALISLSVYSLFKIESIRTLSLSLSLSLISHGFSDVSCLHVERERERDFSKRFTGMRMFLMETPSDGSKRKKERKKERKKGKKPLVLSPRENCTDRATVACWRS
jgi:hypothetical protein